MREKKGEEKDRIEHRIVTANNPSFPVAGLVSPSQLFKKVSFAFCKKVLIYKIKFSRIHNFSS